MRQIKKILLYLRKVYSVDLRALALMRIGIACVIIADLFIRGLDIEPFFTDQGIWPPELIYNFGWRTGYWTFHHFFGSVSAQTILFCVHFLLAVFLLLGIQSRLVTILLLILTISLHNRNLFIQQAGDDLLRLVLLWGCFLPWGDRYSITKKKYSEKPLTFAALGYLSLIASVYLFSAALKTSNEWRSGGEAIYYALSLEQLRLPAANLIYYHPSLLKFLTWVVFYSEVIIPILILLPIKNYWPRTIAFCMIVILHLSIGLTLYVGLFFIIGMISAFGLLPSRLFDRFDKNVDRFKNDIKRKRNEIVRPALNGICLLLLMLSLMINLSNIKSFSYRLRDELLTACNFLRIDQYWGMFSPSVLKKDGWYVLHGMDSIGRQWDLRLNQDYVDYKKPARIVSMYKSDRWRKLAENMQDDRFTFLRPLYCKYIIRKWNREHPEKKIHILNLHFMEKITTAGYKKQPVTKRLFSVCDAS